MNALSRLESSLAAMGDAAKEPVFGARRLISMRWIAIGIQLAFVLTASKVLGVALDLRPILVICAVQAALNLPALWRRVSVISSEPIAVFAQILVDILALTSIAYFAGGATTPLISLYLPLIAVGATILPPRLATWLAGVSIACYSLVSLVHAPAHVHDPEEAFRSHLIGMWVIFVCSALTISWFVVRLTAAIRSRDAELAAARESALRNERVVALGNLAAGAAHELGTPLATMAIVAGELAADPSLPQTAKADVQTLLGQVLECKRIITRLAARAGSSRAEGVQPVSADVWIEQLVERWRRQRPQVVPAVQIQGALPGPRIAADATLDQALLNLFNNAADASPDQVEIHACWDGQQVQVDVLDRGSGIPPEIAGRLGLDLVSTRDEGAGMGVVLALSAVEQSGGTLSIADRVGGGTLAKVHLPLASIGAGATHGA
ncbi:MAG TPA: ATP-binding protein [Burkholderiaceae bacterium]|jgi:two-component system sensor histidine kinase RegB|nr:ATP-binding protein [Burkholderiaceae bacterium]